MILKCLYDPLIKGYEQFIFSQMSEIRKFKSGIPRGNRQVKFITGKASQPPRKIAFFPKKCNQKSMFSGSKT